MGKAWKSIYIYISLYLFYRVGNRNKFLLKLNLDKRGFETK